MHICTIVARNYLPAARVLARSFQEHNPGGTCWTLVIDDRDGKLDPAGEPFTLVRPEQLGIEPWHRMTAGYNVLELSTAVKPWLLRHLLAKDDVERVAYLDPDIQVFDSVREVDDLLREHSLVVNPHLSAPMPRDGNKPAETDILVAGSFNLGFAGFAAGPQTDRLLDWWAERLATDCVVDPEHGYFVDQRWMDFAPGLVEDLFILRDPGYNLAYWNFSGRDLRKRGNRYEVDGQPLRFFHYSGFDPERRHLLSKHQNRIQLSQYPVLLELCRGYAQALEREGHAEWSPRPYGFGKLADGTPLDNVARAVFRDALDGGALPDADVFTPEGTSAFLAYLNEPAQVGASVGVTRYLARLQESRPDLRQAFPDLDGLDGSRLTAWAQVFGSATGVVPPALLPLGSGDSSEAGHLIPGVNVVGYFKAVLGVGEHARQLVAALETQGVPVHATTLHPHASPEDESLGVHATSGDKTAFNLVCVNADVISAVSNQLLGDSHSRGYTIGYWAWEVSAFPPEWLGAFGAVNEVWVGSKHVHDAVASAATVPVVTIPQPVSLPERSQAAAPPPGLPDGFRLLFAFDYFSVFERKNPLAAVEAFTRAFEPGSGASLIVKTLNHDHDIDNHERLRFAVAAHPDVHLIEERLSPDERDGLFNACDCYVSLHRAEGFGYTMAEAMWEGKPVIATAYSGNLDYMTADNSYLVDYSLVPIGDGHAPYPSTGEWANPDTEHAARLMREVFDHPEEASRRGERAAADIRKTHSPETAGRVMTERLRLLMATPALRAGRASGKTFGALQTDWVSERISAGPIAPAPRFGRAQSAARKSLLRLLKPVTVHQRLVDGELLKGIEAVDGSVQALAISHAAALRQIDELRAELESLRSNGSG